MLRLVLAFLGTAAAWQAQQAGLVQTQLKIQDAIADGQLAEASRLIEGALADSPHEAGLLNLRGIVHAQRQEWSAAHEDFLQAVRGQPNLLPAWQNLARACQIEGGQSAAATAASCSIDAWQHVLRLKHADTEAYSSLALLLERQGRFAESLQHLDQLPAGEQTDTANLALRCADLSGLHREEGAKVAATQLARRSDFVSADFDSMQAALDSSHADGIIALLLEALKARGETTIPQMQRLAIAYEHLERLPEARRTLEEIALVDPKNPAHLLELARLAEEAKDHEGALGYLAHARELTPDDPKVHFLFGIIAAEMDLPVEARRSLEHALALRPENADYNFAMGSVILSTRDAATASTYLEKYVRAKPADPKGHYALGVAYFASGDYEKTKQQMQYIRSDSKATAGAEYFLGRIARMQGDGDEASRRLRRSVELMPSFSESHTELARVLLEQGNLLEAHKELDRAIALDPKSFQGNAQLLVLYRRTHDPRAGQQADILKQLDEDRSKRAELMLRTIEVRP